MAETVEPKEEPRVYDEMGVGGCWTLVDTG